MSQQPGTPDPAVLPEPPVPDMPLIRSVEQYIGVHWLLVEGQPRTIGWRWRPAAKGGPYFAVIRRSAMGGQKVVESFPLTPEGWARAWNALVALDPAAAGKTLEVLKQRQLLDAEQGYIKPPQLQELDARTLVRLAQVALLGGYAPDAAIAVGEHYDARFLEDRLVLCGCGDWTRWRK
jgi:hypothetical protein